MLKKILFYIFNILLLITSICCLVFGNITSINSVVRYILLLSPQILFLLSILFKMFNRKILYKLFLSTYIVLVVSIIIYTLLFKLNILSVFSSVTSLKNYILSTAEKGILVYILIQILQVVFLPIPASIICIVGSLIYGPWLGGLYCCIGVLVGSYLSYFIGKVFGYKLVTWIVGKENTDKYSDILRKRGGVFLSLAFLLPMFPDDILCFIAGTTKMRAKTFLWITLITRPIGVVCMALFGSGYLIPFSGWGIYAWGVILVVAVALVYIIFRWQEQIQNYILSKIFRKNNNKKV